jgi:XRE family transcriptional regulator, regulator of sulfur utilization
MFSPSLAMQDAPRNSFGEPLRVLRKRHGYTLARVAELTELSKSFVALVEAGKSDITIGRLLRLTSLYGVSLADILPDVPPLDGVTVMRAEEHRSIKSTREGIEVSLLTHSHERRMSPTLAVIRPAGKSAEFAAHPGEEFLFVQEGELHLQFADGEESVLRKADSAYFNAERPHAYENAGSKKCVVLMVVTPPTL